MSNNPAVPTALIVVDVQESFRQRPYWNEREALAFCQRLQALINGAKDFGIPIAQIFHVEPTGPFSLASGHVTTLAPVSISPDEVFYKKSHSALVGSGLDVWLTQQGIRRVLISGIRTEQCCETTARVACDLGFDVTFVTDATTTSGINGLSAREIIERTEQVLAAREFATIVTADELVAAAAVDAVA